MYHDSETQEQFNSVGTSVGLEVRPKCGEKRMICFVLKFEHTTPSILRDTVIRRYFPKLPDLDHFQERGYD